MTVQANHGGLGRQVDDAPAALGDHVPGAGLSHEKAGLEVDVQGGVPGAFADVDGLVQQHHACAVDQVIQALEMCEHLVDGRLYLVDLP